MSSAVLVPASLRSGIGCVGSSEVASRAQNSAACPCVNLTERTRASQAENKYPLFGCRMRRGARGVPLPSHGAPLPDRNSQMLGNRTHSDLVKRFCAAPDVLEEAGEDPTPIVVHCVSASCPKMVRIQEAEDVQYDDRGGRWRLIGRPTLAPWLRPGQLRLRTGSGILLPVHCILDWILLCRLTASLARAPEAACVSDRGLSGVAPPRCTCLR